MKKIPIFSIVSWLLLLATSLVFAHYLRSSQLIPQRMWIIAIILFAIVLIIIAVMILRRDSHLLNMIGGVLALVLCAAFIYASVSLNRAVNVAQGMTDVQTTVTTMCVYMDAEDTDDSSALTPDMRYGILEQQDRSLADEVVKTLENEFECELDVRTYLGITDVLDALFHDDVDAIILNSAMLHLIDETEGYKDIYDRVREVRNIRHEKKAPVATTAPAAETPKPQDIDQPEATPEPVNRTFTIYFSGIDNRGELIDNSRSDVNIVGVINPDTHQILLVSTPRDFFVPLVFPEYTTSRDKLTHAGIYGVQVSMDTLSALYDIDIDYYFRVNFDGFIDIVEAMGGVTVEVDEAFSTTEYSYPAGPNYLNGYKALSFVRNRFGIGDHQRGKNQLAFIKGVIDKATSTDMLLNFNAILDSCEGCFQTSMPYDKISEFVREQLDTKAEWNVVMYSTDGTGNSGTPYSLGYSVFVIYPDQATVDTAKEMMQMVYNGEILPSDEEEEAANP